MSRETHGKDTYGAIGYNVPPLTISDGSTKGPIVVGPVAKCSEKTFVRMVRSHKDYKALEPVKMSEGEMISQCCIREESLCRRINERGRFWLEKLL